jgi:lipoprotein-anchoring transpeptidase ErfK/SrfK
MQRAIVLAFIVSLSGAGIASAQQMAPAPPVYAVPVTPPMVVVAPPPPVMQAELGGGFIEYLFGDGGPRPVAMQQPPPPVIVPYPNAPPDGQPIYINTAPGGDPSMAPQPLLPDGMDPRYLRQEVAYHGSEAPGTIVIDTPNKFLYLVEPGGQALRYGIGVGRPGFTWAGVHKISAKKEWPEWVPPAEMLERQPYLPHLMAGGPNNPLGARALYLGSTLYRIHGSNEPWTIGHNVSSGCIRMRNADVIDLYDRVKVGTTVEVL